MSSGDLHWAAVRIGCALLVCYRAVPLSRWQASPDFGRIVNARHFARLKDLMDSSAGEVVVGGKTDLESLYIEPTIIRNVSPDSKIMRVRNCVCLLCPCCVSFLFVL